MSAAGTAESARGKPALPGLWYAVGGLMLLLVAVLSLVPVSGTGVNDKLSHLVTYFVLGGWFALLAGKRSALAWTFVALVAYGGGIGVGLGIGLYFTPLRRLLLFVDRRLAEIFLR